MFSLSLQSLYPLARASIIALEHTSTKRVWLTMSHSALSSIDRLIASNELSKFIGRTSLEGYTIKIYDSVDNRNILLLHLAYYENFYKKLGYALYKRLNGLYYKVRIDIGSDLKVYVKLVNRQNKHVIAGVFEDIKQATLFKTQYLDVQEVIMPVIAINEYTREYYNTHELEYDSRYQFEL